MSEASVCKVCNQNEATEQCGVCGIDLCEMCKQVVQTEDISASHRVKGMSTEGVLGPAQKRRTVCAKCLAETDFIDKDDHGSADLEAEMDGPRKDRLKGFKKPDKGEVTTKIGDLVVDLNEVAPDIRGNEDLVSSILNNDYIETRVKQYDTKLRPFARAQDLAEWDGILLNRFRPLYTQRGGDNAKAKGKGRKDEVPQALKNLQEHLSATGKSLASARQVLDEALKVFGPDKEIELGQSIVYPSCNIAVLTGFEPKNLGEMDRALNYGEAQYIEQATVVAQGTGDQQDLESRALHLGSVQFLAAEAEELVKICCFDSLSVGDLPAKEMASYPNARTPIGLGTVDKSRPVLAFFGDDFLPIFYSLGRLEEEDLAAGIEMTGLGNAGHELVRLYPAGKVLTTTGKAIKGIRSGIPDLIVASDSCYPLDIVGQAQKAGIPVLATGARTSYAVADATEEAVEDIVKRLQKAESLAVHSVDKAAEVVAGFFKDFSGKMGKEPDQAVVKEAEDKCTACDKCFHACPNSLTISTALKGGAVTLADLYDRCIFCGQCEDACPENIPVMDSLLAVSGEKIAADNFRMRPGRGPLSHLEFRDLTFGLVLGGNGPGMVALLGCGHNPGPDDELMEIAKELLDRNCVVMTAGCGAADVARKIEEKSGTPFPEQYPTMATLKGLVNCGGCAADSHILASMFKFAQLGGGISVKANYDQPADYSLNRAAFAVIIWGPASDKMMAKAAGFARVGAPVIIGPSGFKFSRGLVGNKYKREDWTMYDGLTGDVREVDPSPPHLIYPVETKEEAVTMALKFCFTTCALRDPRLSTIDNYTEIHDKYFHKLPDDWTYYLRSPMELHVMKRMKFLKLLRDEYGWEVDRTSVQRVRNRDGKLVSMGEYTDEYGIKQGRYATMVKRLIMRESVKE